MEFAKVVLHTNVNKRSRLQTNTVTIFVNTISDEVVEDPTTGHRTPTGRSTLVQPPIDIKIHLCSSSHGYIYRLLRSKLVNHPWLCEDLASEISTAAPIKYGFVMEMIVDITYPNVVVLSDPNSLLKNQALWLRDGLVRLVVSGRIVGEEPTIETEPCSICLDNLTVSSKHGLPTRMTCSHVFHDCCLLEWLQVRHEKNCPLCRTMLFDLDDFVSREVSLFEN